MKLYLMHIDEMALHASMTYWLGKVPEFIFDEVHSYKMEADRWRVLTGKLLLIHALRDNKAEVRITALKKTPKGRLFFNDVNFDFNISHSGKFVVLAWSSNVRVGVDIEMQRRVTIDLFRRNFTDGEWEVITGADDIQEVFFKAWAVKESLIKADGRGVEVLGKTEILSDHAAVCDDTKWWYSTLQLAEGYTASVASPMKTQIERVNPDPADLLLN